MLVSVKTCSVPKPEKDGEEEVNLCRFLVLEHALCDQ
jgi:hypothetical protein